MHIYPFYLKVLDFCYRFLKFSKRKNQVAKKIRSSGGIGILVTSVILLFSLSSVGAEPQFLVITDIHYGADNTSKDGHDTGPQFLDVTLNQFKKLSTQAAFILNLGDLPTHLLFASPERKEYERTLFHALYEADAEKNPFFYIPGNNDSFAGNYQPFEVDGQSPLTVASDWTGACLFCKDLIIDDQHMRHGGYYSSYAMPANKEIILIALNTAPLINIPALVPRYPNQEADALAELAWLNQQLKAHSAKQLLIAMHVPPGVTYKGGFFWQENYLQRFIDILKNNAAAYGQITLLSGHTHMDELRKIVLPGGGVVYNYSTPAISRIHYNNPGMKIFSLNKEMAVKNYTTYYTTSLERWGTEQYHALGSADAVFPQCHSNTLAQCLNSLSDKQVCTDLEQGLFYGVKSDQVPVNVCHFSYVVRAH